MNRTEKIRLLNSLVRGDQGAIDSLIIGDSVTVRVFRENYDEPGVMRYEGRVLSTEEYQQMIGDRRFMNISVVHTKTPIARSEKDIVM